VEDGTHRQAITNFTVARTGIVGAKNGPRNFASGGTIAEVEEKELGGHGHGGRPGERRGQCSVGGGGGTQSSKLREKNAARQNSGAIREEGGGQQGELRGGRAGCSRPKGARTDAKGMYTRDHRCKSSKKRGGGRGTVFVEQNRLK